MAQFHSIVTTVGCEVLTRFLAEERLLTLTAARVGTGRIGSGEPAARTELVSPASVDARLGVRQFSGGEPPVMLLPVQLTNKELTAAVPVRELGIFGEDENGDEFLFCYSYITGDDTDNVLPVPEFDGEFDTVHTHDIAVLLTNQQQAAIEVTFCPDAMLTAAELAAYAVPLTRTVNGKALTADITLTAADLGLDAAAAPRTYSLLEDMELTDAALIGLTPDAGIALILSKMQRGDRAVLHAAGNLLALLAQWINSAGNGPGVSAALPALLIISKGTDGASPTPLEVYFDSEQSGASPDYYRGTYDSSLSAPQRMWGRTQFMFGGVANRWFKIASVQLVSGQAVQFTAKVTTSRLPQHNTGGVFRVSVNSVAPVASLLEWEYVAKEIFSDNFGITYTGTPPGNILFELWGYSRGEYMVVDVTNERINGSTSETVAPWVFYNLPDPREMAPAPNLIRGIVSALAGHATLDAGGKVPEEQLPLRPTTVYGECSTGAAAANKEASITDPFTPVAGSVVGVKFINGNTAENPALNIAGAGAFPIRNALTGAWPSGAIWQAGETRFFMFNNSVWLEMNSGGAASGGLVTGTYTGQGEVNTPVGLSFPFRPKMVIIRSQSTYAPIGMTVIRATNSPIENGVVGLDGLGQYIGANIDQVFFQWNGNALTWYSNSGSSEGQLSVYAEIYSYIAIG